MTKVMITKSKLDALVNAYNELTGETGTQTLDELATSISEIQTGGGGLEITDMSYMFYQGARLAMQSDIFKAAKHATNWTAAFMGIHNEASQIDFTGIDTSSTTNMMYFLSSTWLAQPDLSALDTSKVTNFGYFFYNSSRLTTADLSGFDTSSLTACDHMFTGCEGVKTIDMHTFDLSRVTSFDSMFSMCKALETLRFPTAAVSIACPTLYYMFNNCSKLVDIDLSMITVTSDSGYSFANAFYYCTSLKRLALGHIIKCNPGWLPTTYMFGNCSALEELVILEDRCVIPISGSDAFSRSGIASGTCQIYVPDALVTSYQAATNWSAYASQIHGLSDYPDTPWWAAAQS